MQNYQAPDPEGNTAHTHTHTHTHVVPPCLVGWLAGWLLVGWMDGWLVGWLDGWLDGGLSVCWFTCLLTDIFRLFLLDRLAGWLVRSARLLVRFFGCVFNYLSLFFARCLPAIQLGPSWLCVWRWCVCDVQHFKSNHSVRYHTPHLQLCLHCSNVQCFLPLQPFVPLSTTARLHTGCASLPQPAARICMPRSKGQGPAQASLPLHATME